MLETNKSGLIKRQTLTNAEATAIEQLTATCNAFENLRMRLSMEMLRKRSGNETNDFLYYEDGMLVGYLNVDSHGVLEKELTGMVHPDYRRGGIFRALLAAAKEECDRRGVQKLILVCEHVSRSGQAFVQAIGASHDFSEHEMVLGTLRERSPAGPRLRIRKADFEDREALAFVHATSFGDDIEGSRSYIERRLLYPWNTFYLGLLGEEPVGCLRVDDLGQEIGIYGFGVRPEYQGRGYGRQLLEEVIRIMHAGSQKGIMLDAETDNANAVGLYLSCGFEIRTTYGYYSLNIQ
ncbi:MAG TPA: GNAT family N-acetyltransferase [Ktedonobacteraceae bacterium]